MANIYSEISSNKRKTWLILFFFLVFIIFLGWVFSRALNEYWILPVAVIFAISQAFISYWWSDKITLAISSARPITHEKNPEIFHIVENLCITTGLPMPKIYVINDTAMNAFATGRDPKHAVICYTQGILDRLSKTEIEGVTAHELSHIGNYDIRLMTIVVVLVGIVTLLADWFLRISFWGGDDNNDKGQLGVILMIIGLVLAIVSPLIAMIIKLALSRRREYLADSSGALATRYPEGLASALEKIGQDKEPLEAANKATAHLYITNPLKNHKGSSRGWFAGLFETHPPLTERIKRLRAM